MTATDHVSDQVKTNDAGAAQLAGHDMHTAAGNAMAKDVSGYHGQSMSSDAATGARDALQTEAQKGMIATLNEVWNKPMGAGLAEVKAPNESAQKQAEQERVIMAGLGLSDMNHGKGENAAAISEEQRARAFNALFSGSDKNHLNMTSNRDGQAANSINRQGNSLQFDQRQLRFAS